MKKIIEKIKEWLTNLPVDKWILFIIGLMVSSFFCIVLKMVACIVPSIALGFIISFIYDWKGEKDWWKMGAVVAGGIIIQLFAILA